MLGRARARFWVMENGSSGGAGLDICRYLQLSHQAFNTPQSLRRADLQQWRSLSRYLQRFGRKLLFLLSKSSQTAKGRKGMLGQGWGCLGALGHARAGFWVMENGSSGGAGLDICRYLQLSHQAFNTPQSLRRADGYATAADPHPSTGD